jgi:hypothetical protein
VNKHFNSADCRKTLAICRHSLAVGRCYESPYFFGFTKQKLNEKCYLRPRQPPGAEMQITSRNCLGGNLEFELRGKTNATLAGTGISDGAFQSFVRRASRKWKRLTGDDCCRIVKNEHTREIASEALRNSISTF